MFPLDGAVAHSLWPDTECYSNILGVLWNQAGLEG